MCGMNGSIKWDGNERLPIIDLAAGAKPLYNDDKRIAIAYDGKIYNYEALKASLEKEGIFCKTNSDGEVILRMYEKQGISSFSLLDGSFVFSIYDKKLKKIIIVRDFFGIKPMYYYKADDGFYWSSELKNITNAIDKSRLTISEIALNLYFRLTYIPAPYTIYNDIFKLEPNTLLEYDLNTKNVTLKPVDQSESQFDYSGITEEEALKICYEKVCESVASRSVSEVPVGTFLSGGVDSSIVSWCLAKQSNQKIDTFSVGFENKKFDESDKARTVAKLINSNHHEFMINETELTQHIDQILLNFEEPFADSSALATYSVAEKTNPFVKVVLTGDGGDEVFGGYNKYYIGKLNAYFTRFFHPQLFLAFKKSLTPLLKTSTDNRGLRFKLKKLIDSIDYQDDFYYNIISLAFQYPELKNLLNNPHADPFHLYKDKLNFQANGLKDFRRIDKYISLEGDSLVKVGRTSRLALLECRSPFLNKEIWQFTNQLPDDFLIRGSNKKYILKKAFESYFPTRFFEKSKQGFGVPVGDWLRNSLKDELMSYINTDFLKEQNLFNPDYIKNLVLNHLNGKMDNTFKVWTFYCFQKWYKNFTNVSHLKNA